MAEKPIDVIVFTINGEMIKIPNVGTLDEVRKVMREKGFVKMAFIHQGRALVGNVNLYEEKRDNTRLSPFATDFPHPQPSLSLPSYPEMIQEPELKLHFIGQVHDAQK